MKTAQLHKIYLESSGVCTDTRKIEKDCIFFALKGENFDGNKFAAEAWEKGAKKVVIDDSRFHKDTGETILCKDVLKTLQELATYHRNYLNAPIIALTGSNGKTTTKELINAVLSSKYNTTATQGNLNNHIGVPLTLLSMDSETEMGIVEMGANHLKEIELLCEIAKPNYGYITNFGKAHLEGFGSVEGVIQGKTELYAYLRKNKKMAFVNGYDAKQIEMAKKLKQFTFGNDNEDCSVTLLSSSAALQVSFKDEIINSHLVGSYNFHNIAAAIAIGDFFKVSKEAIKKAIESYTPTNNRSQIIQKKGHTILLDAYNANPTSMLAALKNFKQAEGDNKVMILGDMFELGKDAEAEHQAIVSFLEAHNFGKTYLVGKNFYKTEVTNSSIIKFEDFETFKKEFSVDSHATFLIKGSRGMALERTLELI